MMARRKSPAIARISLWSRLRTRVSPRRMIVVGVLAVFGGWLTFALAVSGIARQRAPQQALMFAPWDGVAIAAQADLTILSRKTPNMVAVEDAGRRALANQAVNPRALRLLAMAAELRGESARSEKLIAQAEAMSRRDMLTQFYLIESAIQRDDVAAALNHYDVALRTNRGAGPVLFPRLLVAISSPRIRDGLRPYIKADVPWTREFVDDSIARGTNLSPLVTLIADNGGLGKTPRARQQHASLLDLLFNQQKFDDLQRLYRIGPDVDVARLTSAALAPEDRRQMISAIGWQMAADADSGGTITVDRATKRPVMAVYANAGNRRGVARKLLYLPPGSYRFDARLASITPSQGGGLTWQLRCLDPAASTPAWRAENVVRSISATLVIPAGCKVQLLELVAAGGTGQTGIDASINAIALTAI